MPRISHFYGISIYMYYANHAPPHLHAFYGREKESSEDANEVESTRYRMDPTRLRMLGGVASESSRVDRFLFSSVTSEAALSTTLVLRRIRTAARVRHA